MKYLILVVVIVINVVVAFSQDSTVTTKLDTVLSNQKTMLEIQKRIYDEVKYEPPLANKKFGIELNLARLLVSSGQDFFTLTGTVSFFDVIRSGEIAFPFFYQIGKKEKSQFLSDKKYEVTLKLINLDATYRHFLGQYQDGFYFSTGVRYTYIEGMEGDDILFLSINQKNKESSINRFGAYFGLGYRYFTKSGFYWGVSLIYGRYFDVERNYQEVLIDDTKTIIDVELLKFGIAF